MGNSNTRPVTLAINEPQPLRDDIIIKSPLEEMIKYFFKDYVIVWHDPDLNSQENQGYRAQLEAFCKVLTFTEWEKARDFVYEAKEICHVITSGTNGEIFVKEIFEKDNVRNIYVFCGNKEFHEIWAQNYQKVQCVETDIKIVLNRIQKNLEEWLQKEESLKVNLPAFAPIFNDSDKSQMNHLHLYLKIIPDFINRDLAKNDFVALSKKIYSHPGGANVIEEFEQTYSQYDKEQTLRWYTRESFLYKMTNKCLRIATSDSIQYCRLVLKDIEKAIKEQYQTKSKNFNGLLYRGTYMSEGEWSSLKENQDKEIEMHGFLSVSKEKNVALHFMKRDPSKMALITIIVPKGPIEEEQGFAEIEEYSMYPQEREILFNVRSRFTVLETEDEYEFSETAKCRHLVLLYGAQGFRRFMTEKNPTQRISVAKDEIPQKSFFVSLKTDLYYSEKYLVDDAVPFLHIMEKGEKAYEAKIKGCLLITANQTQIPFYGYKCESCQGKRQKSYYICTDCGAKEKKWCENCFESTSKCREDGHKIVLETSPFSFWCEKMTANELNHLEFQNELVEKKKMTGMYKNFFLQGEMFVETHEYEKALKYYSSYIRENERKVKDIGLAIAYNQIGNVYNAQGEYKTALECYLKSLSIDTLIYGDNHPELSDSLLNIGSAYKQLGENQKAAEYFKKAVNPYTSSGKYYQPMVSFFFNNMAAIYSEMGDNKQALECFESALDINQKVYGDRHPQVAGSYSNMARVYGKQEKFDHALGYSLKSLDIRKSAYGETHPEVADSYSSVGNCYFKLKKFPEALGHLEKALEISKSLYGDKHADVAVLWREIGMVYASQEEFSKAFQCLFTSVELQQLIYGDEHPDIADSLNNMGSIRHKQKKYEEALKCYQLSASTYHSIYKGAFHPKAAAVIRNIAIVYTDQENEKEAISSYCELVKMYKELHGENHPDLANAYFSMGLLFEKQEEFDSALSFFLQAYKIRNVIYGDKHPDTASSYNSIALTYFNLGDYQMALDVYKLCIQSQESIYKGPHQIVASTYVALAQTLEKVGNYETALACYFNALEINKHVFGGSHPIIAGCYNHIGMVYEKQADYKNAIKYFQESVNIFACTFGKDDEITINISKKILAIQSMK